MKKVKKICSNCDFYVPQKQQLQGIESGSCFRYAPRPLLVDTTNHKNWENDGNLAKVRVTLMHPPIYGHLFCGEFKEKVK